MTLEYRAANTGVVRADVVGNALTQFGQAGEADFFGHFVVDIHRLVLAQLLDGHVKNGFLPGQMSGVIIMRKFNRNLFLVAHFRADKLLLERADKRP